MGEIILTQDKGIARVLINRPRQRNALSMEAYLELIEVIETLGKKTSAKAVVIQGADNTFCSGDDVKSFIPGFQAPTAAFCMAKKSLYSCLDLDFKNATDLCSHIVNLSRKTEEHQKLLQQFMK